MTKKERLIAVLEGKMPDVIPASFWFHFVNKQDTIGENCVKAHLDYYRETDIDFIKIMSDGLSYPLNIKINCANDWYKLQPLPRDDMFFTGTVERCRRINEELHDECCTFYNMFSPFNIVRERDIFTEECLAGRSWDETVMAHLHENEDALKYAMNIIADDLAYVCKLIITEGHCEGIYQSVQGAEKGRMTAEEYARIITPYEMKVINAANEVSKHNILHMCSWAGRPNHLEYWANYPTRVKNWGVGVEEVSLTEGRTLFQGDVLLGGIDNRRDHPMYCGTEQEIRAEVRKVLDEMKGIPFILGADCTIPPDTDHNHIKWVLDEIRNYKNI